MEYYNYVKALHLIFVITWFAGLFYIPRLLIYWIEAKERRGVEGEAVRAQLLLMTKRLWYIITWPSAVLASFFAVLLLVMMPGWLQQSWMHIKLMFVFGLFLYHYKTHLLYKSMVKSKLSWTSTQMRLWNEISTLILFAVVFLVMLKDNLNWIYGVLGLVILSFLLMSGVKIYKKWRLRKK